MPLGVCARAYVRLGYNKEDNGNKLHSSLSSSQTRLESWKNSTLIKQNLTREKSFKNPPASKGEVPVQLPAEEGLHGGRAVGAQCDLLPLGRQLIEGAPELTVEGRQVDVVLGGRVDGYGQSIKNILG